MQGGHACYNALIVLLQFMDLKGGDCDITSLELGMQNIYWLKSKAGCNDRHFKNQILI